MHVQPYDSHAYLQAFSSRSREPAGNTTLTDPRSQRNQVGRRGGQITTRARSSSDTPACPPNVLPTPLSRSPKDTASSPRFHKLPVASMELCLIATSWMWTAQSPLVNSITTRHRITLSPDC